MNDNRDDLVLDGTWLCSGWHYVLPQQATALHMLVATAADRDLDGSLDDLVAELSDGWFEYYTDGLECPVRWTHPLDLLDKVEIDAGDRAQRECLAAFSLGGIVLPSTVRELAQTMAELGIFEVTEEGCRWRTATWPPMPEDALPVSKEFRDATNRRRWFKLMEPNALRLVQVLPLDDLTLASIDDLARVTDLPEIAVRGGLEVLVNDRACICGSRTATTPIRSACLRRCSSTCSSRSIRSASPTTPSRPTSCLRQAQPQDRRVITGLL